MNVLQADSADEARATCDFDTICVIQVGSGSAILSKSQHLVGSAVRGLGECSSVDQDGEVWQARLPRRAIKGVLQTLQLLTS